MTQTIIGTNIEQDWSKITVTKDFLIVETTKLQVILSSSIIKLWVIDDMSQKVSQSFLRDMHARKLSTYGCVENVPEEN